MPELFFQKGNLLIREWVDRVVVSVADKKLGKPGSLLSWNEVSSHDVAIHITVFPDYQDPRSKAEIENNKDEDEAVLGWGGKAWPGEA